MKIETKIKKNDGSDVLYFPSFLSSQILHIHMYIYIYIYSSAHEQRFVMYRFPTRTDPEFTAPWLSAGKKPCSLFNLASAETSRARAHPHPHPHSHESTSGTTASATCGTCDGSRHRNVLTVEGVRFQYSCVVPRTILALVINKVELGVRLVATIVAQNMRSHKRILVRQPFIRKHLVQSGIESTHVAQTLATKRTRIVRLGVLLKAVGVHRMATSHEDDRLGRGEQVPRTYRTVRV